MQPPPIPAGQREARTRWRTHASGEAFDRKKVPYLFEQAQQFMQEQVLCVVAGMDGQDKLGGFLVIDTPGFVRILDEHTCLLRLDHHFSGHRLLQRLQCPSQGQVAHWGLFFICHPTRERLCVHGTAEFLSSCSVSSRPAASSTRVPAPLWIRFHVRQAFFHCSKYIRTRVAGLTVPATDVAQFSSLPDEEWCLTENIRAFLAQQVLCFLCTVNHEGQCAVNHRNGHPGFLTTLPPDAASPGGTIFLPDYAGNGAFEALGNIFETGQAAFVVPNYGAHLALCVSGSAHILEATDVLPELKQACAGAERVVALSVRRVEVQRGDWLIPLAYECARAERLLAAGTHMVICHL